jgi:ATP-dependent Clp protease ATP-binding subunit ClpC
MSASSWESVVNHMNRCTRMLYGVARDGGMSGMQDRLVDEGYNPSYGARPLRRAIMRLLEDSMAERMLNGDIKEGDSVIIDVDADGQISVLNGDKKMISTIDATPAGIS